MIRLLTVVGARPQFIKAAAVSREFSARPDLSEILVHTGQHYDENMSDVFFDELQIPTPAYNLNVGSSSHGQQTAEILLALESLLIRERPEVVVVYGDTNSTLAGALAAAKLQIPVVHVEAGLRSRNRAMPEEINRVLTDHVSDLLLTPTASAMENLLAEGICATDIKVVGDVMYDVSLRATQTAKAHSTILERSNVKPAGFVLVTLHRAENTDSPFRLRNLVGSLLELARDLPVVWPLHPRTRAALERERLVLPPNGGLRVIPPVGYLDMLVLEESAKLIITDSGGVQKEAYFHSVPCVTARDETEWTELVVAGWNTIASPASPGALVTAARAALQFIPPARPNLYGDGQSAGLIADIIALRYRRPADKQHEQMQADL